MSTVLFVDLGNTNVCWRAWCDGAWDGEMERHAVSGAPTILRVVARRLKAVQIVAVVTSPANGDRVEQAIQAAELAFIRVGRDLPVPVETAYTDPSQIGADRLCNALAARERYGAPVVSASAGTCLTVEAMNEAGVVLGGAIAAGVPAAVAGIAYTVPHLAQAAREAAQAAWTSDAPGRSTEENLVIGLGVGAAGALEALIALARRAVGSDAPVVVTGGDAPRLAGLMSAPVHVAPDLTLDGARLAFEQSTT